MQWEADFIRAIQSGLSNGFTDWLFSVITFCGDEIFFMVVAMVFYWCISKRDGFKFINVYFVGCAIVECGKVLVKRPRPYLAYSDNNYVRSIGEATGGYSFPSGHSHSISNMSTQLVIKYRKSHLKIVLPIVGTLTLLVLFSRIFLGQHYLTDVLAGLAIGIAVAIIFSRLFELMKNREEWLMVGIIPLCILASILFYVYNPSGADKVLKVTGAYIAVAAGYFIEKRCVRLNIRAKLWQHILKIVVGGGVAAGLLYGLKFLIPEQQIFLYSFLRYFLVGAWAILGAPALFKLLKLYNKHTETLDKQAA